MVNVRFCCIKMATWLNYIIFLGCLYAINIDALPIIFLDGPPHLQRLLKLLGKGTRKMTLENLKYSFDNAAKVLCISNEEVEKIKQAHKVIENEIDEEKWVDALTEIATKHHPVIFTLLNLRLTKLPTDDVEYERGISAMKTDKDGKSPDVVAAIKAGDKKISSKKETVNSMDYSNAFRAICEAWFAVIQARDKAILEELDIQPPETLLELPFIFQKTGKLINGYHKKIEISHDLLVAKETLTDFRNRLEMMELTCVTSLYDHKQLTEIIKRVLRLEENLGIRIIHLSKQKINLIKKSQGDLLPDLRIRDPKTDYSTEIEELKSVSTKNPTNEDSTEHDESEHEESESVSATNSNSKQSAISKDDENNPSADQLPFEKKIQMVNHVQKYVNIKPFQSLEKKLFSHFVNCRFMLISIKSEQIDFINDMLKQEGRTHDDFCYSWMFGYHMTSLMVHQPGVVVKGGPTKKEKLEAIKVYEERMPLPKVYSFGIYNFAKIIYSLPNPKPVKVKLIKSSTSKKKPITLQANS